MEHIDQYCREFNSLSFGSVCLIRIVDILKVMSILRYPWGPNTMNCRLCVNCWKYWKKYGGLMLPASTRKNILVNRGDGKVLFKLSQLKI